MSKPVCRLCEHEENTYIVYEPLTSEIIEVPNKKAYWDEAGVHYPSVEQDNIEKKKYECSNGHSWTESTSISA